MPDPSLFPEDGLFHTAARRAVKGIYRLLWGCVWRHPGRLPREGPVLVVANHPSYLDPLCLYAGAPRRIHFMAWEALFRVPWMGDFIRRNGVFPVNDLVADVGAYRAALRLLRGGNAVGIFPEAGRSLPSGRMLPFLAGPFRLAARIACPVLPVTVNLSWRIWPREARLPRLRGGLEILFHEPIPPGAPAGGPDRAAAEQAGELARRARRTILGAYRAPADVLARSARPEVLDPSEHPILRADREGVPLLEWLRRNPRWEG